MNAALSVLRKQIESDVLYLNTWCFIEDYIVKSNLQSEDIILKDAKDFLLTAQSFDLIKPPIEKNIKIGDLVVCEPIIINNKEFCQLGIVYSIQLDTIDIVSIYLGSIRRFTRNKKDILWKISKIYSQKYQRYFKMF